ncbi:hypothetical protein D3C87_1127390 [compost metagenome]
MVEALGLVIGPDQPFGFLEGMVGELVELREEVLAFVDEDSVEPLGYLMGIQQFTADDGQGLGDGLVSELPLDPIRSARSVATGFRLDVVESVTRGLPTPSMEHMQFVPVGLGIPEMPAEFRQVAPDCLIQALGVEGKGDIPIRVGQVHADGLHGEQECLP